MKQKIGYIALVVFLLMGIVFFYTKGVRAAEAHSKAASRTTATAPADRTKTTNKKISGTTSLTHEVPTEQNPLLDVIVPKNVANQRINHTYYVCYFNADHRIPNCVIYDISATEISQCNAPGAEKRKNYKFYADPLCSDSPDWYEYKNSGYDRGHMAPANDMKFNPTAMSECFYMTNMCPQIHALNDGCWRQLENSCHNWALRDKRLIIASGPILKQDMAKIGPNDDISVPGAFFKVIYAPEKGRAIGFIFNNEKISGSYTKYVVSVDDIERMTGLDFFSSVDDKIENAMEKKSTFDEWGDYSEINYHY